MQVCSPGSFFTATVSWVLSVFGPVPVQGKKYCHSRGIYIKADPNKYYIPWA